MPKKKWLLGVILATIVTLIAGTCSMRLAAATTAETTRYTMSSSTAANEASDEDVCTGEADEHTPGETYTAPAPTKCDRPGTEQDGYYIPKFTHPQYSFGDYKVGEKTVGEGYHGLKSGTSSVVVTTSYGSGSWTFTFTDADIEQEAENTYKVVVDAECKDGDFYRYREVTAYFTNTAETSLPEGVTEGPSVNSIYPYSNQKDTKTPIPAYDTEYGNNVADGSTAAMRLMRDKDGLAGLVPGKYVVQFWRADKGYADQYKDYIVKRMKFTVPSCSKDDSGPSEPTPSFGVSGSLKQLGCTRVKAVASTREYSGAEPVNFKVIKRMKGRKAIKRSFTVDPDRKARMVVRKPKGAKTVFALKAKQPSGKWVRLARKVTNSC